MKSPPKKGNKRVNKNNRTVSDTKERVYIHADGVYEIPKVKEC